MRVLAAPQDLPAGRCCQPWFTCAEPLARAKGVDRVVFHCGVTQPFRGCSGAGSRAAPASQCWKHRVQSSSLIVFFSSRRSSLGSTLLCLSQWVVLALLGAGGTSGRQVEGRDTLSCLQCLLSAGTGSQPWGRGCRAEPPSLQGTDLIFQSHQGVLGL